MRLAICSILAGAMFASAGLAAPIPAQDGVVVAQCSETLVNVLANDRDAADLPLVLVSVSEASHGTVSIVGPDVVHIVSRDRKGTEILNYVVRNSAGDVSFGQLVITVSDESRCS